MKTLFYACALSTLVMLALMLPPACAPSEDAKDRHAAHHEG